MPLLYSLREAPKKKSSEIMKLIKSDSTKKFKEVYEFVNEYGGMEYAVSKTEEYCNNARNLLKIFTECDAKESLLDLLAFVSSREY